MVADILNIRNARPDEVGRLAALEAVCWPTGLGATADQIARRIEVFPEGQWVARLADETIGFAASQRISAAFLGSTTVTFDAVTDGGCFTRSHHPHGEILQLVSVSVAPGVRGLGVGRRLVDHEIRIASDMEGVRRVLGVTRPRGFNRHPHMSIDDYVAARRESGVFLDPTLHFHLGSGARIVSIHPDYRPSDAESRGYGVLIEYDLNGNASGA